MAILIIGAIAVTLALLSDHEPAAALFWGIFAVAITVFTLDGLGYKISNPLERRAARLAAKYTSRFQRISRNDRDNWGYAKTLADLCDLSAIYLEVFMGTHAGRAPQERPYEETRFLIPLLSAANRAGLFTDESQPGRDLTDDQADDQRAFLAGFVSDADLPLLMQILQANPDLSYRIHLANDSVTVHARGRIRDAGLPSVPDDHLRYGRWLSSRAQLSLFGSWRFLIEDPEPGRDDRLWPAITEYVKARGVAIHPASTR